MDGCLDCWDILYQQRAPLLSVKVSDEPLHTLKVHEGGCLVATGCDGGNVALLELAEGLASAHRNDKTSVTAVSCLQSHYIEVAQGCDVSPVDQDTIDCKYLAYFCP